jgi:hypothetical protein
MRAILLGAAALAAGIGIGLADSSPGWDSTALTVSSLSIAAALVAWGAGSRPWLWALLVGLPTPVIEISQGGSTASLVAVGFAGVGAALGWAVRRTAPDSGRSGV